MTVSADLFKGDNTLIPYFTFADPNPAFTERLVRRAFAAGADIIEIGIPFSESLADGPVIQTSHFRALSGNQINFLEEALSMVERLSTDKLGPIVFMAAYNLILQYGEDRFFKEASRVGLGGIIIPDLPFDGSEGFQNLAADHQVDLIFLVTPQSDQLRIDTISKASRGFVYVVSTTGITGVQAQLAETLPALVRQVKQVTKTPVAVGFGISTAEQVLEMNQIADAAIIGSAFVKELEAASTDEEAAIQAICNRIQEI